MCAAHLGQFVGHGVSAAMGEGEAQVAAMLLSTRVTAAEACPVSCGLCPSCNDGKQKGGETGIECGGTSVACTSLPSCGPIERSGLVGANLQAICTGQSTGDTCFTQPSVGFQPSTPGVAAQQCSNPVRNCNCCSLWLLEVCYQVTFDAQQHADGKESLFLSCRLCLLCVHHMSLVNNIAEHVTAQPISVWHITMWQEARDQDEPKPAVISLLVNAGQAKVEAAAREAATLRAAKAELQQLKMPDLRKRAAAAGASAEAIEDARDGDDRKADTIELILAHQSSQP
eukprot:COSAG06_NODE_246_length_19169_cov_28.627950_20_plen_285_part_00